MGKLLLQKDVVDNFKYLIDSGASVSNSIGLIAWKYGYTKRYVRKRLENEPIYHQHKRSYIRAA